MEIAVYVLVVAVGLLSGAVDHRLKKIDRRLARLEGEVDRVYAELGMRGSRHAPEEARRLARDGKKIQAVKAYRQATGAGLKEAKDAVERMSAGY